MWKRHKGSGTFRHTGGNTNCYNCLGNKWNNANFELNWKHAFSLLDALKGSCKYI